MISDELWDIIASTVQWAMSLEGPDRATAVRAEILEGAKLHITFLLASEPSQDEQEALALTHTTIASDLWKNFSDITYAWEVTIAVPTDPPENNKRIVYRRGVALKP